MSNPLKVKTLHSYAPQPVTHPRTRQENQWIPQTYMGEPCIIDYQGKVLLKDSEHLLPALPGKGGWGVKMESLSRVKVLT